MSMMRYFFMINSFKKRVADSFEVGVPSFSKDESSRVCKIAKLSFSFATNDQIKFASFISSGCGNTYRLPDQRQGKKGVLFSA